MQVVDLLTCLLVVYSPRPSQCVHQVPSGALIEPVEGGVEVINPDGTVTFLPELPECVADIQSRMKVFSKAARRPQPGNVCLHFID